MSVPVLVLALAIERVGPDVSGTSAGGRPPRQFD
jgi:hypothetical protein